MTEKLVRDSPSVLPYTIRRFAPYAMCKVRSATYVAVPRPGLGKGVIFAPILPILHHGAACTGGVPPKVGLLNKLYMVSKNLQVLLFYQLKH
jgi:hypothetical protein